MNERLHLKYKKILEILPDVAECAGGELVLAGGTALALFYLKHRISVDLDFIPLKENEQEAKEKLKGKLTERGYRTQRSAFTNQFVIQFENTAIKVEIFKPSGKLGKIEKHMVGEIPLLVASEKDILQMKKEAYSERLTARDLFDIYCLVRQSDLQLLPRIIRRYGLPDDLPEIEGMVDNPDDYKSFMKVIQNASKTGG